MIFITNGIVLFKLTFPVILKYISLCKAKNKLFQVKKSILCMQAQYLELFIKKI